MSRRVDLLVSPKWIAEYFGARWVMDDAPKFERSTIGDSMGGQLRIAVLAPDELPEGVREICGVLHHVEFVPVPVSRLEEVRELLGAPAAQPWSVVVSGGHRPWTADDKARCVAAQRPGGKQCPT